jgi:hypothetical protein
MTQGRWALSSLALAFALACNGQEAPSSQGTALPTEVDSARPRAPAPAAPLAPVACPDPQCPLFDWMEAHMEPSLVAGDLESLAGQFDAVAAWSPPGYANWASIARDGAAAARDGAADAARAACRSCHEQYGSRYQRELRSHPM